MIYFIRHGETDYNVKRIFQGWLDIPLNENGINQAKEVSLDCKNLKFEEIYCSTLSRAKQTAEIINEFHNAPIFYDDRLKEIYGGSLQGEKINDWPEEKLNIVHCHPEFYGAESQNDLCNRVESFFKEIENSNKNILIVSHGGVYRAIYRYLNKIKTYDFDLKIKNAKIIKIK